jgi:hydroxymethylbilane synthase
VTQTYRVGSRGSALALAQTRLVIEGLQARHPGARFQIVEIVTHGDRFRATPIAEMGAKLATGIFNTALEQAVLRGEVDFATCSFKDVESQLPAGLAAVPVGRREDPRDVLVSRHGTGLDGLPRGAVLATSSPRRVSQLAAFRPDFRFAPLRGNVTSRVDKDRERFDGVVLAAAGLRRLDLHGRITQVIPEDIVLPAPAQGALGCEYAANRPDVARRIAALQDPDTELCVRLEKALLVELSGGCFAPVGILAVVSPNGQITIRCRIASLDGKRKVEERVSGPRGAGAELLAALARRVTAAGGRELVAEARSHLKG